MYLINGLGKELVDIRTRKNVYNHTASLCWGEYRLTNPRAKTTHRTEKTTTFDTINYDEQKRPQTLPSPYRPGETQAPNLQRKRKRLLFNKNDRVKPHHDGRTTPAKDAGRRRENTKKKNTGNPVVPKTVWGGVI